jgi:tape measure domain-containing protein
MSVKQKFIDLVLRGKDLFSPAAQSASAELDTLSSEAKAASDELKALQSTQEKLLKARGIELYAEQAEKALSGAREEVARLAREMDASEKPTKEQSEALKLASRSANQLQTEYNKLGSQLNRAKGDLQQAGVNTDRLADEQNRLQTEIKQSAGVLSEKRTKLREMRGSLQETEKATESFGSKIGGATKALVGFVGAYVGLSKLRDGLVSILSTADQLESYSFQFAALFGGIEQGEQATAWVQDFARNTGTRLGNVRDAFVQLKTFGIDPMNGSLQALVDYNAKLGGSQEKLEGIILAVGQAWGKQKLQGEEILQLVERGIPVWDLLAQATGKSTAELQKLSTAGKLGRDAIAALVSELGNAATGMSEAGLDRLGGQINIVTNNWERFQQMIADSGLYQAAVTFLKDLNAEFEAMASNGQLQKAAQDISDFFSSIIKNGGEQLKTVISNINGFIAAVNVVSGALQLAFNAVTAGVNTLAAGFTSALGGMVGAYSKFLGAVGATDLSKSLADTAALLKELSDAYVNAVEQDSKDMAAAWGRFTGTVDAGTAASFSSATNTVVTETEKQKAAINGLSEAEQARATRQAELAQLMAQSNITTLGSLQQLEQAAKATYDAVNEGAEQGIASSFELEQAFNAWAESALKLAAANKTAVPETLRLQAAQLGLGRQLDELIRKQGLSAEFTDQQGRSVSVLRQELEKTQAVIELYQRVINSETASIEEKRIATLKLVDAQQLLKGQLETLAEVEALRTKTYFDVKLALEEAQRQTELLTQSYQSGSISTQQYNDELERQTTLIRALQGMLIGTGSETAKHGAQQQKTGQQVSQTTAAIEEQSVALQGLQGNTQKATQYTSLLAGAQAYLRKEFDFSGTSSEDLRDRYEELTGFIIQNGRAHNEWWRELARASNLAFTREQQIISETLKIRDYTKTLESSAVTMEQVRRIQSTLNYGFAQLGDNDLAPLRNAIADAERRILSLRDGLAGTVSGLQDELDRLNNNQLAIEKRRYDAQLAELREKLQQAQNSGDQAAIKSAQEALKLAQQIYKIKTDQLAAETSSAKSTAAQNQAAANGQPKFASQSSAAQSVGVTGKSSTVTPANTATTVRVELALPSGRVIPTQASQLDAAALMNELERIRSTSL